MSFSASSLDEEVVPTCALINNVQVGVVEQFVKDTQCEIRPVQLVLFGTIFNIFICNFLKMVTFELFLHIFCEPW